MFANFFAWLESLVPVLNIISIVFFILLSTYSAIIGILLFFKKHTLALRLSGTDPVLTNCVQDAIIIAQFGNLLWTLVAVDLVIGSVEGNKNVGVCLFFISLCVIVGTVVGSYVLAKHAITKFRDKIEIS